jgi:hypothetical protein
MKNILYVGPSWAARSFDTPDGAELDYTNIVKELNLSVNNLSKSGMSNLAVYNLVDKHLTNDIDGIIWVYCEPLGDITNFHRYDSQLAKTVNPKNCIESENFWDIREELNQYILTKIAELPCPVALIGSHSDITINDHGNISVIHPSWQKYLASQVGTNLEHGWGAEVLHRLIMKEFKELKPSYAAVEKISSTFSAWHTMELNQVFNWCHPNKKGNQLFANEISNNLNLWINNL